MKLINMACPHCGAQLEIEEGRKQVYCSHCGSKLLIDDEVVHHKIDDAEEAGYRFEKGRQKAQAEARMREIQMQQRQMQQKQAGSYIPPELEKPKKRRTWLWVLGWLCIFPVPLTILMLRKKDMDPKIKYGIIAAGWLVYFALGMSRGKNSNASGSNQTASVTETKAVLETVKTTEPNKNLEALLGTDEESGAQESTAETKQQESSVASQDPRPQRNGFDHCITVTEGLYEFQVPDYFVQSNDVPFYRGYAETGGKTAFLDIHSAFDEKDPVGEDWFDTEEERDESAKLYLSSMESHDDVKDGQLISNEIYKTENYTGHLFEYKIMFRDLKSSGLYLMFPSEENNHWVSVTLFCTDNTEYRYDEDFKRIIDSIHKAEPVETQVETTVAETAASTVPETTATPDTEPETQAETKAEKKKSKQVTYSTNDLETAKNGNSGVFAYKNRGGQYENYYVIDFDEGYVYFFTNGNGDTTCERLKIQEGDLNEGLKIVYHDGGSTWPNYLHFKWKRQPDHLVLLDQNGYEWDYYSTSLNSALDIKSGKKIYEY